MSSAIINEIDPSAAFAELERAITGLEATTTALAGTITRECGGNFTAAQAVWGAQKRLSEACKAAPTTGGDNLWPRVTAAKRVAERELSRSRRFHEMWKRREDARKADEVKRNRASGPEPFLSSNGDKPKGEGRSPQKAAKSLRDQQLRSRMKGSVGAKPLQNSGKKKQK